MSDWDWGSENVTAFPLKAMPARLPDPASIPPREWLYGTRLIRRFVTVLVAPGGTGKSSYALAVAMSLASGRPLLGEHVHHRVNAWVMSLEDPLDELERRIAALQIRHSIADAELRGRLFVHSGRDRRLTMAKQSESGYEIVYPDKDTLIEAAKSADIGHISVDPFIKSHALEENSNPHMDAAATAWAEVAEATGASIELVHHTRKGAPADIDAARGGKALTDAARVGQIMASMSEDEASEFGIKEGDRWQYVRIDDAKVNMAPRADKARWFHLDMLTLGNHSELYPNGDRVAAIAAWEPPSIWRGATDEQLSAVLDRIGAGLGGGQLYTAQRRGRDSTRWVGHVIADMLGVNDTQAKSIVSTWLRSGLLEETRYDDPLQRRERSGLIVVDTKRPGSVS